MSRVLMVSSEAAPLAKTGGLADVVGALPRALAACGDQATVIIPRYGFIDLKGTRRVYDHLPVFLGPARYDIAIHLAPHDFPLYLVDCPPLYGRPGLYGEAGKDYPDNPVRFAVLARAALGVARFIFKTDILHCHDWQAGLIAPYLRTTFACDPTFMGVKTVFTIHNLGYQGRFPKKVLSEVALDPVVNGPDGMEFFGDMSFIKGGIAYADALTTVSPTYAREIQTSEFGCGLDGALRARANALTGILNGVDYREWNPKTDPWIPAHYSEQDLEGKRICKKRLLAELGLPERAMDRPLLGVVSRFTRQKGIGLITQIADDLAAGDMYLAALGTGEPDQEELVRRMAARHPGRIAARIGFDNALAHRLEAGADIFLMPSLYEPSGLNQMYSLKYGTVPVVRAVGGLNDTIDEGTGFKFSEPSARGLLAGVREAGLVFRQPELWREMMLRGMEKDFSWNRSAGAYSALYGRVLGE